MEPWLSVRQEDALTGGQTILTYVLYYLILLISYVNYFIGPKFTLNLTKS